jgi:O-antigen ligase
LALAPLLTKPTVALALLLALVALALAWRSIAYPIGLVGLPTVIDAFAGSNPLPKGATTFLLAAWIGVSVAALLLRGEGGVGLRGLFSLPVAMAFALLALMMLRLGASGDQSYGTEKIELYFADCLVLLVGAVFLGANRRAFRFSLLLTLAVAAAESVYLIGEILSGASETFVGRFAVSAQEGPILLGRDGGTGVLIAMFVVLAWPRGWIRTSAIVALPLCLISLIAAGSRGPVVACVVGLVVLLSLVGADRQVRRRLAALIGALVGAAIVVPFVVPGSAVGRSLSTILGSAGGLSSDGRSTLWASAYTSLSHHVLLGIGTGGFGSLNLGYPYPHNILLEVGLELGALGLLALVVMIGSIAVRLARLWRETRLGERLEASLLIALLASAVVNAFFSGALPDNKDIWRWGGVAIGMYAYREMALGGAARRSWT